MIRTFAQHRIRTQRELTGSLWEFTALSGPHEEESYRVLTPCCWESHPDFASYRGEGLYRTQFWAGGNTRLEFKGVSHTATVYVDGQEVARHYNAYTAFDVILHELEAGEHTLEIRADNRFSEESALHVPNDYMSYGGVSRPVVLESLSEAWIPSLHVTTHCENGSWQAVVSVQADNLTGEAIEAEVRLTLTDRHGVKAVTQTGGTDASARLVIPANKSVTETVTVSYPGVMEWNEKTPVLYEMTAELVRDGVVIDDLTDRIGFREITIEGKKLLLNGKPLAIRGVCRHEDHPQYGCALPAEAMAYDLNLIKDLGANSVRTSHYPNDEVFLDLCDELGILVWEENHARGLSEEQMRNPNFERQAEEVIREMIPAHYNHPSIYIWGILNECASDTEYGKECYRRQLELIRSLDESRPTSFASCKFKTDICFGLPEVVSYNIYPLWYHNTPPAEYLDDLYTWIQQETGGAGKPFMITEIGAGGLYGYRNPEHSHWTEDYQAEVLERQVTAVLDYPDCMGVYIWQFADTRISEEWWGGRPRTMNNKGLVDEFRRRKMAYDVVKRLFRRAAAEDGQKE